MRCLGTLQRLAEAGASIGFICVTKGDRGLAFDDGDSRARATQVRTAEMMNVANHFGATYECLGFDDGALYDGSELRRVIIAVLRRSRAELIFTHWRSDYNADHEVTSRAVTDASLFTNLGSFEPDVPALTNVPRIFYVNPGDGYGFDGTHFVALSAEHVRRKAQLIRMITARWM